MAITPRPGMFWSVPCRWCGKMGSVKLREGVEMLRCEKCRRNTEVESVHEGPHWRIRTRPKADARS